MRRPRLLDLFCGAGGAAMGYHRAGFDVTGVDIAPQKHYPFTFIQDDALEYVAAHGREYDVIHASPPCQKYMGLQNVNFSRGLENHHPDLIKPLRRILDGVNRPYVIENVQGAPLLMQIIICGHSLGLKRIARHRHFESSVLLMAPHCTHRRQDIVGVYGDYGSRGGRITTRQYKVTYRAASVEDAQDAMGIDWMDWDELTEAIPPAYTQYIGEQLMRVFA